MLLAALLGIGLAFAATSPGTGTFADPLDTPARLTPHALKSQIWGLARVDGARVVAVGPRGHILTSADQGESWQQVASPVSVDLVAAQFTMPTDGWAIGHDGVVLRSTDGGASWHRALDGRQIGALMVAYYESQAAGQRGSDMAPVLDDARRFESEGPNKPLLGLWFRTPREGWLVGQFNLILHTADAGEHWEPWLDRTENPERYSLHAIRAVGDDIYIVGELGLVLKLSEDSTRFERVKTPYGGTWFGVFGDKKEVVAVGLRGNAWRSRDRGRTWSQLATGVTLGINAGAKLPDGRTVLLSQRGQLLLSDDTGENFAQVKGSGRVPGFDVLPLSDGEVLIASQQGVERVMLGNAAK